MSPAAASKLVTDIRGYFDEVQNVRRDLAVLKQIYAEYGTQHKDLLATLRAQIDRVKTLAATQPSAGRAFIEAGKKKLDTRSQDLLTKVEALMDTVEVMRDDVTVRRMRPLPGKLAEMRKEIEDAQTEMQDLRVYINTVRPSWKKTWSNELQNVVEEERFLKHQEEMLHELAEDHRDLSDMFDIIDELMKKQPSASTSRGSGTKVGLKEYVPPEPDASHEGLSTVLSEVQSLAVDPEKRLRAIALAEKARDKELADRKNDDAFAAELGGFVDGKMLKKTGGSSTCT
jgi:chromosome segregation ATPase